jgi:hypothetical protein
MEEVIAVLCFCVGLIFFILSIILFFKIWGMCNDVERIMYMLKKHFSAPQQPPKDSASVTQQTANTDPSTPQQPPKDSASVTQQTTNVDHSTPEQIIQHKKDESKITLGLIGVLIALFLLCIIVASIFLS